MFLNWFIYIYKTFENLSKVEKQLNQDEKKLRDFPIIKTESIMEYFGEKKLNGMIL